MVYIHIIIHTSIKIRLKFLQAYVISTNWVRVLGFSIHPTYADSYINRTKQSLVLKRASRQICNKHLPSSYKLQHGSQDFLLMLSLLGLVQLHLTASSGTSTSTSEFSILPNSNTPCPMRPCYTLSQVMDNSSNYFTSNTTVVFPPGHHEVSTEGQLVIQR